MMPGQEGPVRITVETVVDLVEFHLDWRARLYDFLEGLSVEEIRRNVDVPYGSILGVLLHTLEAEGFWVEHAMQDMPWPRYEPDLYANLQAVRRVEASVRESTQSYARSLTADDITRPVEVTFKSGGKTVTTPGEALTHVVMHGVYHQGQVLAIAAQMGHMPPELDLMGR